MMTCKGDLQIVQHPYNDDFSDLFIYKQLELGCSGLQLKRELLIDLFGEEFPNQLKLCYDSFIQDQIDRFPVYMQNCNSLLPFKVLFQFQTKQCIEKYEQIQNLISKINNLEQNLNLKLEAVSQRINVAASQFLLLNSELSQ
ncbi:Hypothetical_protein [Hexamita inflata]|uniref:Hypothetical_protein n=1 Tax=Hexamita inflata TaxID=28002 RepID=A0AA86U4P2_9EUKA|nr:Hypothetical protein HINF_LOCUS28334 [Hexamita inflata]